MEAAAALSWILVSECPIPPDVQQLLVHGEQPVAAYRTFQDTAIFTNMRLVIRDALGKSGKKVEIYWLPYSSIQMWSSENAGSLDWKSELELWTRAGHIKVKLNKGIDERRLDNLLAHYVLHSRQTAYSPATPGSAWQRPGSLGPFPCSGPHS